MNVLIVVIICFTALLCTVAVTSTIEKVAKMKYGEGSK